MRILEHIFPDQELNLITLRALAKDITEGQKLVNPLSGLPVAGPSEETSPIQSSPDVIAEEGGRGGDADEVDVSRRGEAEESVNDLHEPLGCLMKDSMGRFRK